VPLITNDIEQARQAYAALEARAVSAEQRAEALSAALQEAGAPPIATVGGHVGVIKEIPPEVLKQHILNIETQKIDLQTKLDTVQQAKSDTTFQNFVQAVALAAAIAEAAMPDRAIPSISAKLQSYISPADTGVGVRFLPPELAAPSNLFGSPAAQLTTTSFEVTKVPPPVGAPVTPTLYAVLQQIQRIFADPFWSRLPNAAQVVAEAGKALATSGGWSFAYIVTAAGAIAGQEKSVASSMTAAMAPAEKIAAFSAAVDRLQQLVNSLTPAAKATPVVGDLYALSTALVAGSAAANAFLG